MALIPCRAMHVRKKQISLFCSYHGLHYLCTAMTYESLWRQLTAVYDSGEAKAIVRYVLDVRFGMSATDVYCGKVTQLSSEERNELQKITAHLMNAEPVQYVLGQADFRGRTFIVGPGVLIPRPETEELCGWIVSDAAGSTGNPDILDIGTGSGSIAVTLALDLPAANVSAWDISPEALSFARRNAEKLGARVAFTLQDALHAPDDTQCRDIIVSNPPYVCHREKAGMERNVLDHEPHLALFVPDNDPLLFYRAIAGYASRALKDGGALYFEINPLFADDMRIMLHDSGFRSVETRTDSFGKERFMKARAKE